MPHNFTILHRLAASLGVLILASAGLSLWAADNEVRPAPHAEANRPGVLSVVPDPELSGGEAEGVVQVANLVYAGVKSSECFADHFLTQAEQETAISTSRRFHAVKLASKDVYNFPLVVMTGEGHFELTEEERLNLRKYLERGGFLLSSPSCSSPEWDQSFRRQMALVFPEKSLEELKMEHPVFHLVYDIDSLEAKSGQAKPLEVLHFGGRLGVIYSADGLNDTKNTQGCCCCGGNEIRDAIKINVNVLAYALTH